MNESGLGDVVQSFFSPKAPVGGWIFAAGPVGLYPRASEDLLGGGPRRSSRSIEELPQ